MGKALDREENTSTMFTDFPTAFDTKNHGLLLSKLYAHGFSKQALSFRCSYLKNIRQRAQINKKFCNLKEVVAWVTQGSIDEPFIFNFIINDIYLLICFSTLGNYADDDHLLTLGNDIQLIK